MMPVPDYKPTDTCARGVVSSGGLVNWSRKASSCGYATTAIGAESSPSLPLSGRITERTRRPPDQQIRRPTLFHSLATGFLAFPVPRSLFP
jgi:hypothetical protein